MKVILFDDAVIRRHLLPCTYTRPVADLRVGILTIAEKWARRLDAAVSFDTVPWLQGKYIPGEGDLHINGALCPDPQLIERITALANGEVLVQGDVLLAARAIDRSNSNLKKINWEGNCILIDRTWKIFRENAAQIRMDFDLITHNRTSAVLTDPHTIIYGHENLFVEEGVSVRAAIIDAEKGPVYLGRNSVVMEGAIIKGSFALCEEATVNIGAKIRGDSTIGPYSKVGGEVSNSVLHSYSNKSHDGFLGNSVLGEWCNLGADTNCSNLKNNYAEIKVYDYQEKTFVNTGDAFCGLIMGDHSKSGINTMFNTGTVIGVSANIYGEGYPRNFIPSFSWGGSSGFRTYRLDKALETAERVLARRDQVMTDTDRMILKEIFNESAENRWWEGE